MNKKLKIISIVLGIGISLIASYIGISYFIASSFKVPDRVSEDDEGWDIALDNSGNIYITGFLDNQLILFKFNSSGDLLWNKTWDTDSGGYGIEVCNSGSIYIVGQTGRDLVIFKYNSTGKLLWNKTRSISSYDLGYGVASDSSENIYITGRMDEENQYCCDVMILKFNSSGEFEWQSSWGGSDIEVGNDIILDSLGNVFVTGKGGDGGILLNYSSLGDLQWTETWGTSGWDEGHGIASDDSDNIYITGSLGWDVFLLKYDSSQQMIWNKTWGDSNREVGKGLYLDNMHNTYIVGYSLGQGSDDLILLKFNSSGEFMWNKTWTNNNFYSIIGNGIVVDFSGNIFVIGTSYSYQTDADIIFLKFNSTGDCEWFKTWGN